jgi:hypothetical protein
MDNRTQEKVTQMADWTPERNIHNSRFHEALEAHENILKSLSSLISNGASSKYFELSNVEI